jgi:HD-GYP domain-containing protein (c-di-GMP phosphodiesterase class II)
MSISFALDFVEIDILGVTSNHGKRTAYISLRIAEEPGFNREELHDVVALAILHDNGVSEKSLHDRVLVDDSVDVKSVERIKEHCTIGEENVEKYPFLTNVNDVIKCHHENYDGTGYFNVKGEEIPLMAQIIHIADFIEVNFKLVNSEDNLQNKLLEFINGQSNKMFSYRIVNALNNVAEDKAFWNNLKDEYINEALKNDTPQFSMEISFEKILEITRVFSKIIDSKSKFTQRHSRDLSKKAEIMADYYKMNVNEKMKLIIAADLHDIGKLAIPNKILDSPNKLTDDEFNVIKKHTYYTRLALQEIKGFEEITEWASNHHEKLNGKGYPYGIRAGGLDFNSRLMACLDIYEALTEERPYRVGLSHKEAMDILNKMKDDGFIDAEITKDVDYVFNNVGF